MSSCIAQVPLTKLENLVEEMEEVTTVKEEKPIKEEVKEKEVKSEK